MYDPMTSKVDRLLNVDHSEEEENTNNIGVRDKICVRICVE